MNQPVPFREKVEKSRQTFCRETGEDYPPAVQELFRALDIFKQQHPVDLMAEYNRIRKGSD